MVHGVSLSSEGFRSCHQDFLVLPSSNYSLNCQNHGTRCPCSSLWSQTLWRRSLLGTRVISARAPVLAVTLFGNAVLRATKVIAFLPIIYLPLSITNQRLLMTYHSFFFADHSLPTMCVYIYIYIYQLPITYYLLPISYYPLPITYYLLPITYYL